MHIPADLTEKPANPPLQEMVLFWLLHPVKRSMQPQIGISAKHLKSVASLLSVVLADAVVLYTKTRKFHWNVKGESFMELHLLFEKQYNELEEAIDEIAE